MSAEYSNKRNTLIVNEKEAVVIDNKNNVYRIPRAEIKKIKLKQSPIQILSDMGDVLIIGEKNTVIMYDKIGAGKITREVHDFYFSPEKKQQPQQEPVKAAEQPEEVKAPETESEKFFRRANTAQEIGGVAALTVAGIVLLIIFGFAIFIIAMLFFIL